MFDLRRTRFYLLMAVMCVCFILWSKWQIQFTPKSAQEIAQAKANATQSISSSHLIPGQTHHNSTLPAASNNASANSSKLIHIQSDVLRLSVNLKNGNIVEADLLQYPKSIQSQQPVAFLFKNQSGQYIAQSGILSPQIPSQALHYKASKLRYTLDGKKTEQIPLTWSNGQVTIIKTYTLTKGSYTVGVHYKILNHGKTTLEGQLFGQVVRTPPVKKKGLYTQIATYTGGVFSTPSEHYQKVKFSDLRDGQVTASGKGGWAAMVEHYFITAWIPNPESQNHFYGQDYGNNNFGVGTFSPNFTLKPGQSKTLSGHFYIGPTLTDQLASAAPNLTLTIDYGWLWFISKYLFMVLTFLHGVLGNWGWSIVVITLLIKLVFFPLSHKSYKSMAKMRTMQPKMSAIQAKYKTDRVALQKATMELYQKEGVNPIGGCLPMLVQIPIFIALYWMLMASVELRQAPWIGWIHDLSVHDPYYILPVLTGVMMLSQQLLSPKPPDKIQKYMFMAMPVLFTFFMLRLPAGLGLYMVVNIGVSILQQKSVMYFLNKKPKK